MSSKVALHVSALIGLANIVAASAMIALADPAGSCGVGDGRA